MRVTSEQYVHQVAETKNVSFDGLLFPGSICVALAKNFIAHYKVSEMARLGGNVT